MLATAFLLASLTLPAWAQDEAPADDAPATEEGAEEAPAEAAPAGPVNYKLDPGKSHLTVVVYFDPDRWTPINGHDHAMEPKTFDGKVTWSTTDAGACSVDISFPATALEVDPPGSRARANIDPDGTVGDGQKGTIVSNMLGKHQLQADSHPTISFKSTSCDGTTGKVNVTGTINIRGVDKTVTAPMTVTADATSFGAKGAFSLTHKDFGMKPYTLGPGTPKNLEKLLFLVDVKGNVK